VTDFAALAARSNRQIAERLFDATILLDGRTVRARSDQPFAESLGIGTAASSVTIADTDVGDATVDTPVVLRDIDYKVGGPPEPDGMGFTVLRLRRA
jgi:hypothetical protein